MQWPDLKQLVEAKSKEVRAIITKLKSNTAVDVSIEATLAAIPVVGGFFSTYWSRVEANQDTEALESIARALDSMALSETSFREAESLMRDVGESLEQNTFVLETVAQTVGELKTQIDTIAEATKIGFVKDALKVAVSLMDDRERREGLIAEIRSALTKQGQDLAKENLLTYGMLFMMRNELELAEACLLEFQEQNPETEHALTALATLYQRRAHEYVIQRNYGLAEDVLAKAQAYVRAADKDVDVRVDLQLAYGYKEIAQSYKLAINEASNALRKARQRFGGVLAVEPDNPSALNGMASIEVVEGRYDQAQEHLERVVEISPDYIEAWSDLAQVYMAQSQRASRLEAGVAIRRKGKAAYQAVNALLDRGYGLPEAVVENLQSMFRH